MFTLTGTRIPPMALTDNSMDFNDKNDITTDLGDDLGYQ